MKSIRDIQKMGLLLMLWFTVSGAMASAVYPAAVFDFTEKGQQVHGYGNTISTLIFAQLSANPQIVLVDREQMEKLEGEAVLTLSGAVSTNEAIQVGQLTGAKIIITGTVFDVDSSLMIVSRIIGTETSRVLGATVQGQPGEKLPALAAKLAEQIAGVITQNGDQLVAKAQSRDDAIESLRKQLSGKKKPSLKIEISERNQNVGMAESSAETEIAAYASAAGFEVLDKGSEQSKRADIIIKGQGYAENATRKGDLIGVRARLEISAVDTASGVVITAERETDVQIDLGEMTASKKAMANAAGRIATRLLPKLTK